MKKAIKLMSIIVVISSIACCFTSCELSPDAYYIFADISECEKFSESGHANIEITSRKADEVEQVEELEYTAYYGARYKSDEVDFEIVAFEFVDNATAKEFYRRVEGVQISGEAAASSKHNFPYYYVRAVDGNRAYAIACTSSNSKALNEFLSQMFSIKLG